MSDCFEQSRRTRRVWPWMRAFAMPGAWHECGGMYR